MKSKNAVLISLIASCAFGLEVKPDSASFTLIGRQKVSTIADTVILSNNTGNPIRIDTVFIKFQNGDSMDFFRGKYYDPSDTQNFNYYNYNGWVYGSTNNSLRYVKDSLFFLQNTAGRPITYTIASNDSVQFSVRAISNCPGCDRMPSFPATTKFLYTFVVSNGQKASFFLTLSKSSDSLKTCGKTNKVFEKPSALLKEIRQDGKPYLNFTYDSRGRMIADNAYVNESYAYDSLGRLSKRFYAGFEVTYQYGIDGALSSMTEYYPATNKTWMERYHRGLNGAIIDALTFYNGDTSGYVNYKYDCAGNTIERSEYIKNGALYYQEQCVYDSMVNPLQLSFPLDMVKKGNAVSYYYYSVMMSSPPKEYSSSFEYDASGLPLRETRVRTNIDTIHFEYSYEKATVGTFNKPLLQRPSTITFTTSGNRSVTVVSLNLNAAALTSISLCDLSGRRVSMLLKPTTLSAGNHRMPLSLNEKFVPHAGGVFMYVVKVGNIVRTFKMPIIRW